MTTRESVVLPTMGQVRSRASYATLKRFGRWVVARGWIHVLLLLGVTDVGRMVYLTMELTGAARAGVQYGAQNPLTAMDDGRMVTAARQEKARTLVRTGAFAMPTIFHSM